jgi:Sec-independent protein secretion pathway component TatC
VPHDYFCGWNCYNDFDGQRREIVILPTSAILLSGHVTELILAAVLLLPFFFVLFLAIRGTAKPKHLLLCLPAGVLVAFVMSAFLTPTTDIVDVTLYSFPMIGLYVISIVIARFHPIYRRERVEKQRMFSSPH